MTTSLLCEKIVDTAFRSENDITDVIDETFTTTEDRFGELVTIDLKLGGSEITVTEENKKEYVEYVSHPMRISLYRLIIFFAQSHCRAPYLETCQGAV